MSTKVAIVDYKMGNLFSVAHACRQVDLDPVVTGDPEVVAASPAIILPGVGAFADAMRFLQEGGLTEAIVSAANAGRAILGICLGMQLIMERSEENGDHVGLSLIAGEVLSFRGRSQPKLRAPHVGWNHVTPTQSGRALPLLAGFGESSFMYFVHSYFVVPAQDSDILATTRYAGVEYCSVVGHNNILGCQFHPEQSGRLGLDLYDGFRRFVDASN